MVILFTKVLRAIAAMVKDFLSEKENECYLKIMLYNCIVVLYFVAQGYLPFQYMQLT